MFHSCRFTSGPALRRLSGKIRKIKDLTDRRVRESHEPFPAGEIFDFTWPFHYRYGSEVERKFLTGRIHAYAFGLRRGNFKLPSRFSDLVGEISKLARSELREMLFRVKPDLAVDCAALRSTFDYANRVLTRSIWRPSSNLLDDCARRVDTHRLDQRSWPRNPRQVWPSTPSVTELIAMSRRGISTSGLWTPPCLVKDHARVQDLSTDLGLATRIVSQNIVGIRSTVSVPRKFLPWFRYRSGILFLTVRSSIPAGLVRLLLREWIVGPYNLWLRVNCRLKYYLRNIHRSVTTPILPSRPVGTLGPRLRGKDPKDRSGGGDEAVPPSLTQAMPGAGKFHVCRVGPSPSSTNPRRQIDVVGTPSQSAH